MLILIATSIVAMAQREADRDARRIPSVSTKPSSTDLNLVQRFDVWHDEEYTVVWIEPTGDARPVLPPGMSRLPKPGEAVVSPALDHLASQNPNLAARYPNRSVLGLEGVKSRDELFAYVRIKEGRTLAESKVAERVRAFGSSSDDESPQSLRSLPSTSLTPIVSAIAGTFGFLIVPGLAVLAVGVTVACSLSGEPFQGWRRNGVSGRKLAALGVLEICILALPGLVLPTISWGLVSPRLDWVPLVAHAVVRGDLRIPLWLLATELIVGVTLTALFATVTIAFTRVRRHREITQSRTTFYATISWLRKIPLGVAFIALVLGYVLVGPEFALVYVIALIVSVPLATPSLLHTVGARLAELGLDSASTVGQGVERIPRQAAQPFVIATAWVIFATTCAGYIALVPYIEQPLPSTTGETQAVFVNWADPKPEDAKRFGNTLDEGLTMIFREDSHTREEETLVVGGACYQIAAYFSGTSCKAEAPFELPATTKQRLANVLAPATQGTRVQLRLAPADEVRISGDLVVVDNAPLEVLENRVRTAAMQTLPAPSAHSLLTYMLYETPATSWLVNGSVVLVAVLTVGNFVWLIARFLVTNQLNVSNTHISRKGLISPKVYEFAVSYGTAAIMGFVTGLISCTLVTSSSGVSMPWGGIGIVLIVVAVTGLTGCATVAMLSARNNFEGSGYKSVDR